MRRRQDCRSRCKAHRPQYSCSSRHDNGLITRLVKLAVAPRGRQFDIRQHGCRSSLYHPTILETADAIAPNVQAYSSVSDNPQSTATITAWIAVVRLERFFNKARRSIRYCLLGCSTTGIHKSVAYETTSIPLTTHMGRDNPHKTRHDIKPIIIVAKHRM